MKSDKQLTVSFVVAVYQNEHAITKTYTKIKGLFQSEITRYKYELVFVDDGSTDSSLDELKTFCRIPRGSHFLGFYNIPGLAIPLGATPPVSPWINNEAQAEQILKSFEISKNKPITVVIKLLPDGLVPSLPKALENLSKDFVFCGETEYPYQRSKLQIWHSS